MNKELTFAQKVFQYNETLSSIQLNLPYIKHRSDTQKIVYQAFYSV